jgi:LysM repeat protein
MVGGPTAPRVRSARVLGAPAPSVASADGAACIALKGETLTGLAKRYGVSVQALRDANGLSAGNALRAGVTLKIPG